MKIYLNLKFCSKRTLNLINQFKLEHDAYSVIGLLANYNSLELYNRNHLNQKTMKVDFVSKKNNYRFLHLKKNMKFYIK